MATKYKHVSLTPQDREELISEATRIAGPLGIEITPPVAIRILTKVAKGFSLEQARKYSEAVDQWQKEEESK